MRNYPGILFLDQSGELGGAELCLADLAEFCRDRSAVLLFQDGPFAGLLRAKNVPVIIATLPQVAVRVNKSAGVSAYLCAVPAIGLLIYRAMKSAKDFELLYANTAKALVVAAMLAFLLRKKFCFHLHDIVNSDHFSAINRRLIVTLANRAQAVVANSQATAEAYKSAGGKNRRIRVVHNGLNPLISGRALRHDQPGRGVEPRRGILPSSACLAGLPLGRGNTSSSKLWWNFPTCAV
jgi:Glycosyltransferase Family 4